MSNFYDGAFYLWPMHLWPTFRAGNTSSTPPAPMTARRRSNSSSGTPMAPVDPAYTAHAAQSFNDKRPVRKALLDLNEHLCSEFRRVLRKSQTSAVPADVRPCPTP
jgi:hypothetical protein